MAKRTGSVSKPKSATVKRPSQAALPTQNTPRPRPAPAPVSQPAMPQGTPRQAPAQSGRTPTARRSSAGGGGGFTGMGSAEGLNSELANRFSAMQAAASQEGILIGISSGARTIQEQMDLRIENGCPDIWDSPASSCDIPTAIPGQSNHNHGLAIDFSGDAEADRWVAAHAAEFGLHLPVNGENWHLEMIDDDASHEFIQSAMDAGGLGSDMANFMEQANPEDELANRLDSILKIMGQDPAIGADTASQSERAQASSTFRIPLNSTSPRPRTSGGKSGGSRDQYINYARSRLAQFGWSESELPALIELWDRESGWNPAAQNPRSTAFGIAQFLNGTWGGVGASKTSDPYAQIDAGLAYIAGRKNLRSPSGALRFHDRNNWY